MMTTGINTAHRTHPMKLFRLNIVSMAIVLVITTIVAVTTVPAAGRSVAIRSDFLPATGKLLDSAEPRRISQSWARSGQVPMFEFFRERIPYPCPPFP
jgi:hypothetical protein